MLAVACEKVALSARTGCPLGNYEHFVLTFHDSTFECIARYAQSCDRYSRMRLVVARMAELLEAGRAALNSGKVART